jgi:hypothetical protein
MAVFVLLILLIYFNLSIIYTSWLRHHHHCPMRRIVSFLICASIIVILTTMICTIMPLFLSEIKLVGGKKLVIASNFVIKGGALPSIHAEHNALMKLIRLNRYRRMINRCDKLDLVVIRFSKCGTLGESRPCKDCLTRLTNSDININNVYYSNSSGELVMEKFSNMFDSELTKYSTGKNNRKRS